MRQIARLMSLPSTLTAKKVLEDENFGRQGILQFLSEVFKDFKYVKYPMARYAL